MIIIIIIIITITTIIKNWVYRRNLTVVHLFVTASKLYENRMDAEWFKNSLKVAPTTF